MRLLSSRLAAAAVVFIAFGATRARADDTLPAGRWYLTTDADGAKREGWLTLTPVAENAFDVRAAESEKKHPERPEVAWTGSATLAGKVLTIRRVMPPPTAGLAPAVGGNLPSAIAALPLEYVVKFDDELEKGKLRIYRVNAAAVDVPARQEIGSGTLTERRPFWLRGPGNLLAMGKKEIDRGLRRELGWNDEFGVTTYDHIGLKLSTQWLKDDQRTVLQKEADRLFRADGKGEPFWIRTVVQGGARVAIATSVPLGPAPAPSLIAGLSANTSITYTVEDQERLPDGVRDAGAALKAIAKIPVRVYQIPFDAGRAEGLTCGARRAIDADAGVSFQGGVALGYRLAELGATASLGAVNMTADASASLVVYYGLRGSFRIEVEREQEKLVRLRWTKVRARNTGASLAVQLGLNSSSYEARVNGQWQGQAVEAVIKNGTRLVQDYTLVRFNLGADKLDEQQFQAEFQFDLSIPEARAAYDDAVRGSFVKAQELGSGSTTRGVRFGRFTSTLTDRLSFSASFRAFHVLKAEWASRTTEISATVEDLDGRTTKTDSFLYEKTSAGIFGGRRNLFAESLERTVVRPDAAGAERGARASFRFSRHDEHTGRDETDGVVTLAEVLFGAGAVAKDKERIRTTRPHDTEKPGFWESIGHPDHGAEYGKSDLSLLVELDDRAIVSALGASEDAFYAAFAAASIGKGYRWTATRRAYLSRMSLIRENDDSDERKKEITEGWDFRDARNVWQVMNQARAAGPGNERAEAFRKMAKIDGFEMRVVVALAVLGGNDARRELVFTAEGASLAFDAGQRATVPGEDRLPLPPR